VAHLGYFRAEFVQRRRWLDDATYTDLVALCQCLPGPASSQVGLAIGLARAGAWGSLAAWVGFTLPSAVAMTLFAVGLQHGALPAGAGALHALKLVAVAVVAQAVWRMAQSLCPDRPRAALAVGAAVLVLLLPGVHAQLLAIALGAAVGRWAITVPTVGPAVPRSYGVSRAAGAALLAAGAALLVVLPLWARDSGSAAAAALSVVYRAGALTFGGGHVVLPLLQAGLVAPGWISNDLFLAGYGAVQAVPGPLLSFAAYLGAVLPSPLGGWPGAGVMLVAIFAPGALLIWGALPFWSVWRERPGMRRALAGVNAAVVGVLMAAWYDPVVLSAVQRRADVAFALAAFALLEYARWSPVWVVALAAVLGTLIPA
jgi:chromate transporter